MLQINIIFVSPLKWYAPVHVIIDYFVQARRNANEICIYICIKCFKDIFLHRILELLLKNY